ncbi:MAG: sugar phosphate isomerase/epimerase [Candidatus Latescibacteria bacterium]|nr:sugar phosphate isomerase/epimerase [Candidatus Latescibacterota bacterium]
MKLGFVTYQIAKDWDAATLIEKCNELGYQGVEVRATHAHCIEPSLSAQERQDIRKQFEDGGVEIAGIGSIHEYHSDDPAIVRENIAATIESAKLAADIGCPGVKVRPNGLQLDKGIPEEQTLEQIGKAVGECAAAAADLGVQIRVEVHGRETKRPDRMRTIMDHANHDNAYVCWNSDFGEVEDGSIQNNFDLLKNKIGLVHITELWKTEYPWRQLFSLLKAENYSGYTLAEIPGNDDADRILRYYKALWDAYTS